jgi:hypothetical protein
LDILWDDSVDGELGHKHWYRRWFTSPGSNKPRYAQHEAFMPGQIVGIHCMLPVSIPDADLAALMTVAGRYIGLSPWRPGSFGKFVVESVRSRQALTAPVVDLQGLRTV